MPVLDSEILLKLSTVAGAAGNAGAGTPGASLGKYISTTQVVSGDANDLFLDVTGTENAASQIDYQCVFVHNSNATADMIGAAIYIVSQVASGTSFAIGVDPTAISAIGASPAQAVQVASDITAPLGVTFSNPTTEGTALALGDIGPGECKAFWVRRTAANTGSVANDGGVIEIVADTL